jgi:hypothetical protein
MRQSRWRLRDGKGQGPRQCLGDVEACATNISFLHSSKLTNGTTGKPRKTGLTVCRNQIFVAQAFRQSTTGLAK